MATITERRLAGLLLPLFSIRSRSDWGVGELPDLARAAPMLERGGFRLLMTLPLLEPAIGQESPYAPLSCFAIDPLYIGLDDVEEMRALGGRNALEDRDGDSLDAARGAISVTHEVVRPLKDRWLTRCFERFRQTVDADSERGRNYARFCEEHHDWIDDYALFRTLKDFHPEGWRAWSDDALREARPEAVEAAREKHVDEIERRKYIQWIAFRQLESARRSLAERGISLGGDEPFLVAEDSADVWAHQDRYRFDATVGAPPDAFSATGQDWGLPPYRWDQIREADFAPFRARGRHAAKLFDVVRVDHVVGLYRTFHRPVDGGENYFVPAHEDAQRAQGEATLNAFREAGAALIAEDLGVIPDFVRRSLEHLQIPGYRVLRWEERDGRIRPPSEWPALSVATNGTHDTETTPVWWESLNEHELGLFSQALGLGDVRLSPFFDTGFSDTGFSNTGVDRAIARELYDSPSRFVITPIQDVFGIRDRINVPNTVGPHNWSWRLPWSLGAFGSDGDRSEPHVGARLDAYYKLAEASSRLAS